MARRQEQEELIKEVDELLRPVKEVLNDPERLDTASRARLVARFRYLANQFQMPLYQYVRGAPAGYDYTDHANRAMHTINNIAGTLAGAVDNPFALKAFSGEWLERMEKSAKDAIMLIPPDEG
jgi:hypothetical protein